MLEDEDDLGPATPTPRRAVEQVRGAHSEIAVELLRRRGAELGEVEARGHRRRQERTQDRRELGGLAEHELKKMIVGCVAHEPRLSGGEAGVGWGEVMNGGFGLVLDGSVDADRRLKSMLLWDVNNGIARRSWARNPEAIFAIKREMARTPGLKVTLPNIVDDEVMEGL